MEILYEDNHIIAINKHCGELVQGDVSGDISLFVLVKDYIKRKYKKPYNVYLGVTHRIDRPVSGVVLFARTSKALVRLNKMFQPQNKGVHKTYWAIVKEPPPKEEGTLVHFILKNSKRNKSYAYDMPKMNTKKSSLTYKMIGTSKRYYFLKVVLHTGRHHQIRCQLAKIGCPIKGDLKYGFARSNPDSGISLHARSLSFIHPVKKEPVTVVAKPPDNILWDCFSILA